MNKTTLTALFFLVLYFATKPLAYTYPTIGFTEADVARAPLYESDEDDFALNESTSQALSSFPSNNQEEQEKIYI